MDDEYSYEVICDTRNNSQEDADNNVLNVDVAVPLTPKHLAALHEEVLKWRLSGLFYIPREVFIDIVAMEDGPYSKRQLRRRRGKASALLNRAGQRGPTVTLTMQD